MNLSLLLFFFYSVSELYVDIPENGTGERISVSLDVSVLEIGCQCKYKNEKSINFLRINF
jgi:hypothetical protein